MVRVFESYLPMSTHKPVGALEQEAYTAYSSGIGRGGADYSFINELENNKVMIDAAV